MGNKYKTREEKDLEFITKFEEKLKKYDEKTKSEVLDDVNKVITYIENNFEGPRYAFCNVDGYCLKFYKSLKSKIKSLKK